MDTTSKAVAGAIMAGATAAAAVLADGSLDVLDVVAIAGALAAGYLGVYVAPANKHKPRDPDLRHPRRRRQ